jgi:hypothetical protein
MGEVDDLTRQFLSFRTKYRKLREHVIALRKRYLLVQCAWCQRRLGWKRKQAAVPGATSHSIGPRCAADIVRNIVMLTVYTYADGFLRMGGSAAMGGRAAGGS